MVHPPITIYTEWEKLALLDLTPYTPGFAKRWQQILIDGEIELIDQGLTIMVQLATMGLNVPDQESRSEILDELESTAYSTGLLLHSPLALYSDRCTTLPFDCGHILVPAVEHYLARTDKAIWQAIARGANRSLDCSHHLLPLHSLRDEELMYRDWAVPRLIGHLIPEASLYE